MGKLLTARMTNATLVSSVDDRGVDLEAAIGSIFGIAIDQEVGATAETSVFGVVQEDGRVNRVRVKSASSSQTSFTGLFLSEVGRSEEWLIRQQNGTLKFFKGELDSSLRTQTSILDPNIDSVYSLKEFQDISETADEGKYLKIEVGGSPAGNIIAVDAETALTSSLVDMTDGPGVLGVDGTVLTSQGPGEPWTWSLKTTSAIQVRQLEDVTDYLDDPLNPGTAADDASQFGNFNVQMKHEHNEADGYMSYSRLPYMYAWGSTVHEATTRGFLLDNSLEGFGENVYWRPQDYDKNDLLETNTSDLILISHNDFSNFVYMLQVNIKISYAFLIGRAIEIIVYSDNNDPQSEFITVPILNWQPPFVTRHDLVFNFTRNFLIHCRGADGGAAKNAYVRLVWHNSATLGVDTAGDPVYTESPYNSPYITEMSCYLARVT